MRGRSGLPGRAAALVAAATLTLAAPALAARPPAAPPAPSDTGRLTVQRIFGSSYFEAERFSGTWLPDGAAWAELTTDADGQPTIWKVDPASGRRSRMAGPAELTPAGRDRALDIESFAFSSDGRRLLLFTDAQKVWRRRTKGIYWVLDLASGRLTPVSHEPGWQWFAKLSPGGDRVAFARDHDLWVTELSTGQERRLTHTGSDSILNGTTDWVYEEELSLRDGFRWSPDGKRIAYWRFDRSPVGVYWLLNDTTLYPTPEPVHYPKAGTDNSLVRVGIVDLSADSTTWIDVEPGQAGYLPAMGWADSAHVWLERLSRDQGRLDLLLADAGTGRARTVLTEQDSAWVDLPEDPAWLDGGKRFVWSSERSGWRHLYLYDRDGDLVRRLTGGEWPVTGVVGVDPGRGRVWFAAARQGPETRSVGWSGLDGSGPHWVSGPAWAAGADGLAAGDDRPEAGAWMRSRGVHAAELAPGGRWLMDTGSTLSYPFVSVLRRPSGDAVRTVVGNGDLARRLDSLGLAAPTFFTVRAAEGTRLHAWRIAPASFDTTRAHPVLFYVYGGPGSQTVTDGWGGARYLWHQLLARRGIVVVSVDNRGTGARGRDFTKQVYRRLGELETADQLAAIRRVGARTWADASRIGVWGWSYGGFMTLLTTLRSEGAVKAAMAVAPVTDWKLYDTAYTERFMGTPQDNPEGYRASAPLNHADDLRSDLLLVYGTGDDNVHPQNGVLMARALERAGKQFRMRVYPNKTHAIAGAATRVNLFTLLTDYITGELEAGAGR